MILRTLALLLCGSTLAQSPQPLPANYRTILDNPDVLVMRVHYGPHEFVPLHDHSAYPTLYVYLNDSGVIQIDHAPPDTFSVKRPPTHTGAFRVAPGMSERHSITNLSDLPSDFLRVELKSIPPHAIKEVFRGSEPSSPLDGIHTEYRDASIRIDRLVCPQTTPCNAFPSQARSLIIRIRPQTQQTSINSPTDQHDGITWLGRHHRPLHLIPGAEYLRIVFLDPKYPH